MKQRGDAVKRIPAGFRLALTRSSSLERRPYGHMSGFADSRGQADADAPHEPTFFQVNFGRLEPRYAVADPKTAIIASDSWSAKSSSEMSRKTSASSSLVSMSWRSLLAFDRAPNSV